MLKNRIMINIPYGESDFKGMIEDDYFYQDRTQFIETLEKWKSKYPVFLRPRRFGKSLFVSTLHHYYGLEHKNDFKKLFGKLYIGQHSTKLENISSHEVVDLVVYILGVSLHYKT